MRWIVVVLLSLAGLACFDGQVSELVRFSTPDGSEFVYVMPGEVLTIYPADGGYTYIRTTSATLGVSGSPEEAFKALNQ